MVCSRFAIYRTLAATKKTLRRHNLRLVAGQCYNLPHHNLGGGLRLSLFGTAGRNLHARNDSIQPQDGYHNCIVCCCVACNFDDSRRVRCGHHTRCSSAEDDAGCNASGGSKSASTSDDARSDDAHSDDAGSDDTRDARISSGRRRTCGSRPSERRS